MIRLFAVLLVLTVSACDSTDPEDAGTDAGSDAAVMLDGDTGLCAMDLECGDQRLFCVRHRCMPGAPGANAMGCVEVPACPVGQSCDEDADACGVPEWCTAGMDGCSAPGDCDGDGAEAIECGGNDCADDDAGRYPTNPEVCDAANVDEDCDPTTFGDTDVDMDTYVDAACCNGSTCGTDCNDDNGDVHPDASEACNGQDMDCDGTVDNATGGSLCPGGLCVGGRCRADGWDRTWGGTGVDTANGLAVDSMGNVYVVGQFQRIVTFGGMDESASGTGGYLLSWAADGSYRWHIVTTGVPLAVAVDPSDQIVIAGSGFTGPGSLAPFIEAFDAAGGSAWRVDPSLGSGGRAVFTSLSATAEGVVAAGHFSGAVDFGGGTRSAPAGSPSPRSAVVAQYTTGGSYALDTVIDSTGAQMRNIRIAADASVIAVAGEFEGGPIEIEGTTYVNEGDGDLFVTRLNRATGAVVAHAAFSEAGDVTVGGVAIDGASNTYVVGEFDGVMSFGGGRAETSPRGSLGFRPLGFVLAVDGTADHSWHETIRPTASANHRSSAGAITADATGILVSGSLVGAFDFGGGIRGASDESTVFLSSYTFAGAYRDDQAIRSTTASSEGDVQIEAIVVGAGGMTVYGGMIEGRVDLGSGRRTSAGSLDGFVVRIGS